MKTSTGYEIEKLVYKMLTTNTGKALCDSGDAYGRHWQTNAQKTLKDFQNEPEVTWDGDDDGYAISYTISLFHFLTRKLELDDLCRAFNRKKVRDWDSKYYGVSADGEKWLEQYGFAAEGESFNSYNGETALSQVIQGQWFKIENRYYVLIQIHQGCDVRGGYTDAKLFYAPEGFLSEQVYGIVTRKNGEIIHVDNYYNGHSITDENGKDIEITKDDEVELSIT